MRAEFPQAVIDGSVSREKLKEMIAQDKGVLRRIEEIVHPLVSQDRQEFLDRTDADIAVLDIPLLFETGADTWLDAVAVVSVDFEEQKRRLMERARMTPAQLDTILQMQAPDAEKRARADYVIETDTLENAREQVQAVVREIRGKLADA